MDFLDDQMICYMNFLQHLRDAWLRHAAISHVLEHRDTCPHCEERTTWTVRMLNGYARCQQCGRNPLVSGESAPVEQPGQPTLQPEPHVPA
jgi:ribosomal protein L37AE/L43A